MRRLRQSPRCQLSQLCHLGGMKAIVSFLMVLAVSCTSVVSQQTTSVNKASKLIATNSELQVLDVRRPDEYKAGHLKGSRLVTWGEKDFEKQALAKLSKGKPVLVYCRSGRRSTAASEALAKLGFGKVHNLEGGITAWQAAGKPVVK